MNLVVPAILPSSREDLDTKLELLGGLPDVRRIQIDVVDGMFATPPSWPYTAPHELERFPLLPHADRFEYEIDLMCYDALTAAEAWLHKGATRFTFHAGAVRDLGALTAAVREWDLDTGRVALGIALPTESDARLLEPYVKRLDYVQFMGIARIGVQGEPFDARAFSNVRIFRERHPEMRTQVDGGIRLAEAEKLVALGVSNLVVGSGILKASDPGKALEAMNALRS